MNRILVPVTHHYGAALVSNDINVYGQAFCQYGGTIITWGGRSTINYHDWLSIRLLCTNMINPSRPYWLKIVCDVGEVPKPTTGASMVLLHGNLLIFGGHSLQFREEDGYMTPTDSMHTNKMYLLDLTTLHWNAVNYKDDEKVPSPRDKCCAWAYGELAYFFGGYGPKIRNSNEFTDGEFCAAIGSDGQSIWNNQLLSYNVKQNCWKYLDSYGTKPSPRAAASSYINKNLVYIFGGRKEAERLNDLYVLNMNSLIWTLIDMNFSENITGRSWSTISVTADNSRIYVWGGRLTGEEELLTSEILVGDLLEKRWSKQENAANRRYWHVGGFNDGVIYAIGGLGPANEIPDPFVENRRVQPSSLKNIAFNKLTIPMFRDLILPERLPYCVACRSLFHGSPQWFQLEQFSLNDILRFSSLDF